MKIINLCVSNIKRIHAVEIAPDGDVITIGGKNGAGKSSILDAVAYALGGNALVPDEPIRRGEAEGSVRVDLGDITVSRKFKRDHLDCSCQRDIGHAPDCDSHKFGPVKSSLVVESKDGARYPSPQAMLDKLYGDLTFDPLAFASMPKKEQRELLMKLCGFDGRPFEERKAEVLSSRAVLRKMLTVKTAELEKLPILEAPDEEVDITQLSQMLSQGEAAHKAVMATKSTYDALTANAQRFEHDLAKIVRQEEELERQLAAVRELRTEHETLVTKAREAATGALADYLLAQESAPQLEPIHQQLVDAEQTNKKVRLKAQRVAVQKDVDATSAAIAGENEELAKIEAERIAAIEALAFPVPGLGFTDDGVTFNGLPFDQASTSEQLKVSVGMGLAMNPKIKVLLIRRGESLDSASMTVLSELAAQHHAQLWVERMTETGAGVSVMIEDGSIAPVHNG